MKSLHQQTSSRLARQYSNLLRAFALLCVAFLLSVGKCEACTRFFPTFAVRPDFTVEINLRERSEKGSPMSGVRVSLSPQNGNDVSSISDSNGKAYFGSLKPGHYFLVVEMAGVESEAANLEVSPDKLTAKDRLEFGWPLQEVFKVQTVSGRFGTTKFDKKVGDIVPKDPLVGATVTLTDVLRGREISSTVTDEHGNFNFDGVPDALYKLHIAEAPKAETTQWDIKGDVLVDLSRSATNSVLPRLNFGMTSCGLTYTKVENKNK